MIISTLEGLGRITVEFGFRQVGSKESITLEHLNRLVPYLPRFNSKELEALADGCHWAGFPEWSTKHLYQLLSEEGNQRYHPSDDNLVEQLEELAKQPNGEVRLQYWLGDFLDRHDPIQRPFNILKRWLSSNQNIDGLKKAAVFFEFIGSRRDVALLDDFQFGGSPKEIEKIKSSAQYSVFRRSLD